MTLQELTAHDSRTIKKKNELTPKRDRQRERERKYTGKPREKKRGRLKR